MYPVTAAIHTEDLTHELARMHSEAPSDEHLILVRDRLTNAQAVAGQVAYPQQATLPALLAIQKVPLALLLVVGAISLKGRKLHQYQKLCYGGAYAY